MQTRSASTRHILIREQRRSCWSPFSITNRMARFMDYGSPRRRPLSLMRFGSNEGFLYRVFKTHVARGTLKLRVLCKRLRALLLVPKFTQYQPENVEVIRCLWVVLDCVPCGVSRFL